MRRLPAPAFALLACWIAAPPSAVAQPPATQARPAAVRPAAPDSAAVAAVADSIAGEVVGASVAGVAIGVAHRGRVLFRRAYGWADPAAREPLAVGDPHQIGSLTKQFTAAAVLQLVEEGRMELDDPVQTVLPDFDTQGRTVTIHHLLNHTSGIRSYTSIYGMNPVPPETVLDTIQRHPFDFEPGERFLYNNSGYYLLGSILEAVTGVPYARHLEERLFEPLGLTSTSYCGYDGEPIPEGYEPGEEGLAPVRLTDMAFPGAAGGLCSTVDDLLAWQWALVSGEVVEPGSYTAMTTPAVLDDGAPMSYGYGLGLGELAGHPTVAHGGGIPGYNTYLSWYPADSVGVVVLVNTSPGPTGRIEQAVARAALDVPQPVVVDLPLTEMERAAYVGTYDLGEMRLRVFEREGTLVAMPTGQPALAMRYQGDHTFLLDAPAEIRLVFEMDGDLAGGFTLHQGGAAVPASRVAGGG